MTEQNVVCRKNMMWIAVAVLLLSPARARAAHLVAANFTAGDFSLAPQSAQDKEQEKRDREQEARDREQERLADPAGGDATRLVALRRGLEDPDRSVDPSGVLELPRVSQLSPIRP